MSSVEVFTEATVADSGFVSLGDYLRAQPFTNGQSLVPADAGTSFSPGISGLNVRGLGNNQPLFLINGRRGALYAMPAFDGFQSAFDLNSLPEAAIDRIAYFKGDESARFGSGAQGGVFDVILKEHFEGLHVGLRFGDYFDTGAFYRKGSVALGTANAKSSLIVVFSIEDRPAVQARDLDFSSNADQTDRGAKADARWTIGGWDRIPQATKEAYLIDGPEDLIALIGFSDPGADGYLDNRSNRGFPGYVTTTAGRRTWDAHTFPDGVEDPFAALAETTPRINTYNFQESAGLFPQYRRMDVLTGGSYTFSDRLSATFEASFNRVESEHRAAEPPADLESSRGLDRADEMTIFSEIPYTFYEVGEAPFINPTNPFGMNLQNGKRRLVEFPVRHVEVTSDTPRLFASLEGKLGEDSGWEWELGALYSRNSVHALNHGASDSRLQQGLLGLTRLGDGSLAWDPGTHPSERVYFNWFGLNEQAMVEHISVLNPTTAAYELYQYDFALNGSLGELPGGTAELVLGVERREENGSKRVTELNVSGDLVGGSEGVGGGGGRRINAARLELDLPLVDRLAFQFAGRWEDDSDAGVGPREHFKVGARLQPLDGLRFHASFGESYRAPDLAYLYVERQSSFSNSLAFDPVIGPTSSLQQVTGGNPDLGPEHARTWLAGLSLAPTGVFHGLSLAVDFLRVERTGLIDLLRNHFDVADFLAGAAAGDPLFVGRVKRDPITNEVIYIMNAFENLGRARYEGFDYSISYDWEHPDFGRFALNWTSTQLLEYAVGAEDRTGQYLAPEWRHALRADWNRGDWAAHLFGSFVGSRIVSRSLGTILGEGDELLFEYTVKAQWIWNLNATYSGFGDTDLTVGVNNLFNAEPPADPGVALGATAGMNDLNPAQWYIRVDRAF